MEYLHAYLYIAYALVFVTCLAGAFSDCYSANLLQRLGIFMLAIWAVWRIQVVWKYGCDSPQEPLLASALALYAAGSLLKTLVWNHYAHRTQQAIETR